MTHVTFLPLAETRGLLEVEAMCGRLVPRVPLLIDNLLPTCPQCAALLIASLQAMHPRLVIPNPPINAPADPGATEAHLHDAGPTDAAP